MLRVKRSPATGMKVTVGRLPTVVRPPMFMVSAAEPAPSTAAALASTCASSERDEITEATSSVTGMSP